jgi:hypothetical protein
LSRESRRIVREVASSKVQRTTEGKLATATAVVPTADDWLLVVC